MFMHRNTVVYHIKKKRQETGLDPLDFYDMCVLIRRANEEGNND
jgi:DNA-binding PucR family transcriptional regulator